MFSIQASTRESGKDLEALRKEGFVPAVFYGAGETSTAISVPAIEFKKVWRQAGESTTVKLDLGKKSVDTLIHEVQTHPVTDEPLHVDFLVVDMNKKIQVSIPLEFIGVAPAVKNGIGTLVKVMHEVEVEALPKDLPHTLEIDISSLDSLESQITVSQIKLPSGVSTLAESTDIVVSIVALQEEKEQAPVDLSAIEVEKKGKKEEEGEGEGASQ